METVVLLYQPSLKTLYFRCSRRLKEGLCRCYRILIAITTTILLVCYLLSQEELAHKLSTLEIFISIIQLVIFNNARQFPLSQVWAVAVAWPCKVSKVVEVLMQLEEMETKKTNHILASTRTNQLMNQSLIKTTKASLRA